MEFPAFPKIPRWNRDIIVTEKIDGTNALIWIADDGVTMRFGSRSRWIQPTNDNYGFARWGEENRQELLKLGPGVHYGEWWGQGIQRGYGLKEKRFSLFNATKWRNGWLRSACVSVVPTLYEGPMLEEAIRECVFGLNHFGSKAAPGFMKPEGVIVFHTASGHLYKITCENDAQPKSNTPILKKLDEADKES